MEQTASQIVGSVVNIFTGLITKHIGHVTSSTNRVADMIKKMEVLKGKRKDVNEHMESNKRNNKEIPDRVEGWLGDVENVKKQVQSISINDIGCLDLKKRYQAGRSAFKTIKDIERLIEEEEKIKWSDTNRPFGKVTSKPALMYPLSPAVEKFKSRHEKFKQALNVLQQDDKTSQVIALCGMGGVGKTTMMEQLKKVAEDNNMFHWIVKVVFSQNYDMFSIQKDIAVYMCDGLQEASVSVRGDILYKKFVDLSQAKQKTLVILDDVWEKIELKHIGLRSPLPNGVKLLLTSRDSNVCTKLAVDVDSVPQLVKVDVLEEAEALEFFSQITGVSIEDDHDMYSIGCDIVKKCGCLPLAMKIIASTVKSQDISVWTNALSRLKKNDLDENVQEIINISYERIEEEDRQIFLHCGLFPEDYDILIEDLTRHAWGIKVLKNVSTLREARDRTKTSVETLKNANLLIDSDHSGCVKMHDLVHAFVLGKVSKGDNAWIINHGDVSKWETTEMGKTCERISLTCKGVSEFPRDIKHPNLSLLQLMHGDLSLKFPEDLCENMENLKVMSYYQMQYPRFPRSLQCLSNLKSLCFSECKLMFDNTFIGDLVNLEVLSFAHCGIRKLPSTIGKLRKLKLLDLTGCVHLHIDDGVFKNLEDLEELYMSVSYDEAIRFTDTNFEELKMLSSKLCALEVEFVQEKTQLKNLALTKLYRFKIAIGCVLEKYWYNIRNSFENTLKLLTDSFRDLQDCKINELFNKTEKLHLQVGDMIGLEDIVSIHHCDDRTFCNLRDLEVSNCVNLKYLFPMCVANGLRKLERLTVRSCCGLKALVHDYGRENNGGEIIKFEKLKFLSLQNLPKLASLEDVFSIHRYEFCNLRDLWVSDCVNLKYLFPMCVANGLRKLERLTVRSCSVLEALVVHDYGREINSEGEIIKFEKLKFLSLWNLPNLASPFLVDDVVDLPHLVELKVDGLPHFTSIYPDDNDIFALQQPFFNSQVIIPVLNKLKVKYMENLTQIWPYSSDKEVNNISMLRVIEVEKCECLVNLFPTNPMRLLNQLETLTVNECNSIEVIFNIDLGCVGGVEQVSNSSLRSIKVKNSEKLREVWRIKGCENNSSSIRIFEAVKSIKIKGCKRFRNVFTPTNIKFDMRAVVDISVYDYEETRRNNELINVISSEEIPEVIENISNVAFPSSLIPTFPHQLSNLTLRDSEHVKVVFEMINGEPETPQDTQQRILLFPCPKYLSLVHMERMTHVWKCDNWNKFIILQTQHPQSSFDNLTTIEMESCNRIKYLFSPLMMKLFPNLEKINISRCKGIEEVVSNRDDKSEEMTIPSTCSHTTTNFFPRLHSLNFSHLDNLKHIGGVHDESKFSQVSVVSWSLCQHSKEITIEFCKALSSVIPSYAVGQMRNLQVLIVKYCRLLTEVFETQVINHNSGGGITNIDEGNGGTTTIIPRLESINVPQLSNLKKMVISGCDRLEFAFTFSTLESLKQLEELMITNCNTMKVIVKEENGEQTSVVMFSHLKSLELVDLPDLEGFFLGRNDFLWASLEKVKIDYCPKLTVFTPGQSTAKKLEYMHTCLGKHSLECGLNFHQITTDPNGLPSSKSTSMSSATLERLPAWSFHNLIEIDIYDNWKFKCIIPSTELLQLQKLERIRLDSCYKVKEIFEVEEAKEVTNIESQTQSVLVQIPRLTQLELTFLQSLKCIWKSNHHVLEFPNLTTLTIDRCLSLEHVFTSSMVGCLLHLEHLDIRCCKSLQVIVKEKEKSETECDAQVKQIVLPCLKSLKLVSLESLKGFFLGKDDFSCPSLHTLEIKQCPELTVFTMGHVATPTLDIIDTCFGRYYLTEDINSFIENKQREGFTFSS